MMLFATICQKLKIANISFFSYVIVSYKVVGGFSPHCLRLLFQELGKSWEEVQSEDDRELVDGEDE